MKIFKTTIMSAVFAAALTACGGGGGSAGETSESYTITLRAERTSLPVNVGHYSAGIGVNYPFTTTLYVNAKKGSAPIPGGEDIFGCNTEYGLPEGALYYLDGDDEHTEEVDDGKGGKVKVPKAYRSVTLGANSGGNSFHFHAGDQAGTATITCSVTDPRSNSPVSASVNITVGAATGMAASIQGVAAEPVLVTQDNKSNLRTGTAIQAYVWDDANQRVPDPSSMGNLQVSIRPVTAAAIGARLLAGSQSGSVLQVKTIGGVGLFSLASGLNEGAIVLDMVADRKDNDVTNGIQDPVSGVLVLSAVSRIAPTLDPLVITTTSIEAKPANGVPFSYVLEATGGQPPYTWSALSALPAGLSLSSAGVISGTPNMKTPGTVNFAIRVTDAAGNIKQGNFTMTVEGSATVDPLAIVGCGTDVNSACKLVELKVGDTFSGYALTTSGGPATGVVAWTATSLPAWLSFSATAGIVTAVANPVGATQCGNNDFFVTATKGTTSVTNKVRITVVSGTATCP